MKAVKGEIPTFKTYILYIMFARSPVPAPKVFKICCTTSFENQWLRRKYAKKHEKSVVEIWRICCKAVLLHPLSREKRRWVEILNKDEVFNLTASKKTFWKKLWKSFGSSKIVLTFASAFEKKAIKKSSLKDLDMNKQVVQFLL